MEKQYYSKRNKPLLVYGEIVAPTLTLENYIKWYDIYVVFPDGHVETLTEDKARNQLVSDLEHEFITKTDQSAYGDHIFNPDFLEFLARRLDFVLDELTREAAMGRWIYESGQPHINKALLEE